MTAEKPTRDDPPASDGGSGPPSTRDGAGRRSTHDDGRPPATAEATGPNASAAAVAPFALVGPLQTVSYEQSRTPTSTIELVLVVALLCVGALLTYHAVRGYRRNDDPDMALFAAGLCLLTVVHALLKLAAELVVPVIAGASPTAGFAVAAISQFVDVVGLVVVFYAVLR